MAWQEHDTFNINMQPPYSVEYEQVRFPDVCAALGAAGLDNDEVFLEFGCEAPTDGKSARHNSGFFIDGTAA